MSGRRFHAKASVRLNGQAGGNGASKRQRRLVDTQTKFEFLLQPKGPEKPSESPPPPPKRTAGGGISELLDIALQAAVPLRIRELRKRPLSSVLNLKRLKELGDVIAERGDIVMFGSKKKGRAEDAFNKLAEALARLAFAQGGVTFNGVHYEAANGVA